MGSAHPVEAEPGRGRCASLAIPPGAVEPPPYYRDPLLPDREAAIAACGLASVTPPMHGRAAAGLACGRKSLDTAATRQRKSTGMRRRRDRAVAGGRSVRGWILFAVFAVVVAAPV